MRLTLSPLAALALTGAIGSLSAVVAPADAAIVSHFFEGNVADDPDATGHQSFTGLLWYDNAATDVLPAQADAGVYPMTSPGGFGLRVSFDGQAAIDFSDSGSLIVLDDHAGWDWLMALGFIAGSMSDSASVELIDVGASALTGDGLPAALPSLGAFSSALLKVNTGSFALTGRIEQWSCDSGCGGETPPPAPIPEPGTWALLAGGLGLLAWMQRRRPRPLTA